MFQEYEVPFSVERENISLSVEKEEHYFVYRRQCLEENVEKILAAGEGNIILNPVEPLTKPKELTPYFLFSFQRKVMLEPKAAKSLYLRFPIEIGAYLASQGEFKLLDTFTLVKPKFTLYGTPRQGFICKYYKSDLYPSKPEADPSQEGIMELSIKNDTANWVELGQVVFNAYGMKIYYNDHLVSMKAMVEIGGANIAETGFIDASFETGMKKSLEAYRLKKLSLASTKFIMELGI
jgi:hypothetical protein